MTDNLPTEPVAWFRAPYGTLEPNPLFRVSGPQSLEWAVACFTEDQMRAYAAAAVAERDAEIAAEQRRSQMFADLVRRTADALGVTLDDGWHKLPERVEALRVDAERLDWIEAEAKRHKIEFAGSILGTGFEVGQWKPTRATVTNGNLRAAIDRARGQA